MIFPKKKPIEITIENYRNHDFPIEKAIEITIENHRNHDFPIEKAIEIPAERGAHFHSRVEGAGAAVVLRRLAVLALEGQDLA